VQQRRRFNLPAAAAAAAPHPQVVAEAEEEEVPLLPLLQVSGLLLLAGRVALRNRVAAL